jgi:hypothetical protein
MTAINYPFLYYRNYYRDFPAASRISLNLQKIITTSLPLLSLFRSCRVPLSVVLSGARIVTQTKATLKAVEENNRQEALYQGFHFCLTAAAFGLLFSRPALSYAVISSSDLLDHLYKDGTFSSRLFKATLDGLFLASFLYGAIEITIACATLQIFSEFYASAKHWEKKDYFESLCQAILAIAHLKQAIPQYRLAQWKYESASLLEGVLKRNHEGFVYLDIPDEQIHSLLKYCGKKGIELPPYFKPGMAGGHITVIPINEKTGDIPELGRRISFRISHADSFDLTRTKVHLVAIVCPELEGIRSRQALSPRLYGDHDFHITYGIENV